MVVVVKMELGRDRRRDRGGWLHPGGGPLVVLDQAAPVPQDGAAQPAVSSCQPDHRGQRDYDRTAEHDGDRNERMHDRGQGAGAGQQRHDDRGRD